MDDGREYLLASELLVDAHVHVHACHGWGPVLACASRHFRRARRELAAGPGAVGCLMLTEGAGIRRFDELRAVTGQRSVFGWTVCATGESESIVLRRDHDTILVVSGRQIITVERLEVLALGCDHEVPDGLSVQRALELIGDTAAAAVLPWGFGKWWFDRGRLVRRLVDGGGARRFFLGDNGGRPRRAPQPPLFEHARHKGIFVLHGSDPLALPDHESRSGSYGFRLSAEIPRERPVARIRQLLQDLRTQPESFGERQSLASFASAQLRIRRIGTSARRRQAS